MATVLACPDSGSFTNVISASLARHLGFVICKDTEESQLILADGRKVSTVGIVTANITFGLDPSNDTQTMSTVFYVLNNVPSWVIMGMWFLETHKVLSECRGRLIRSQTNSLRAPTVASVGTPRYHILCELNHDLTAVTPDTGSEADLMSTTFAANRGFEVHPVKEHIELADGSIAVCEGFVRTTLSIGTDFDSLGYPRSKVAAVIDFFLLEDLTHDVVLGEHYVDELEIYTKNKHAVVLVGDTSAPAELNRIRMPGAIDKSLSWLKNKIGITSDFTTSQGKSMMVFSTESVLKFCSFYYKRRSNQRST